MHKAQRIQPDEVRKIAKLANLPVQNEELTKFSSQFSQTVDVIGQLNEVDTAGIPETYQVNNLVNVAREDVADTYRTLSQDQALSQAKITHQGYFVVPRVIDSSDEI